LPAVSTEQAEWTDLPKNLSDQPAKELLSEAMISRSIRSDGLGALTLEGRLIGLRTGLSSPLLLSQASLEFNGYPLWLGDHDLLLVHSSGRAAQ